MADLAGGGKAMIMRELARKRQAEKEAIVRKMQEEKQRTDNIALKDVSSRFAVKSDFVEEKLKIENVGLVTHEVFMQRQSEAAKAEAKAEAEKEAKRLRLAGKRKRVKPSIQASKLSFGVTDGEDGEEEEEEFQPIKKRKTFGKNPSVDTSFLPDKEREQWEQTERERLKEEWTKEQDKIKATEIPITYSYWDGTGHRRTLTVQKGASVGELLEMVRKEWKELRAVSVDNLLFIKEDLILPHDLTFYDLIVSKARGKSGPLFHFDVHDDVRLMSDATKEKEESHAAKVVERHWYERNNHIFPANRWEVYDPKVQREKYTVKDTLQKN